MTTIDLKQVAWDQNQSSLLRLPPSIRQLIYLFCGLGPTGQYDLPHLFQLHGSNRPEFCRFHGLLLSCRTVYDEASELLYRDNRFIIRYGRRRSLEALRNLTSAALTNLRHLKVILNEASCHSPDASCKDYYARWEINDYHEMIAMGMDGIDIGDHFGQLGHDQVMSGSESDAELLFAEWASIIEHLSSRISPALLNLSVVCDVFHQDVDAAKRVVAPLARLPLLKDCHLRLSNLPTPELNRLARDAALKARVISYPQDSYPDYCSPARKSLTLPGSRLMTLPLELRLNILEYTDLVTPWKEITWCRHRRAFIVSHALCTTLELDGEECKVHHGCQFVDCWRNSPEPSIGCFCRLKHSAFSSHCECWEPPLPLLLACRTLYKEAQSVLFSQNRFVIHDYNSRSPLQVPLCWNGYPLAGGLFLDKVVPRDCLRYLRSLEFVFPAYDHDCWAIGADWRETINLIKGELNLPALTIRLVMARPTDFTIIIKRRYVSKAEGEKILSGYERILDPLVQLGGEGGLAGFHADFEWPWSRTDETTGKVVEDGRWEWVEAEQRALEERAERLVLGDDRYELQSRSKFSTSSSADSLWVRKFIRKDQTGWR